LLGALGLLSVVVVSLVAYYLVGAWLAAHPVLVPVVGGEVTDPLPLVWLVLLSLGKLLLLLALPAISGASFALAAGLTRRDGSRRARLTVLGVLLTGLTVTPWWGALGEHTLPGVSGAWADLLVAGLLSALLTGVLAVALLAVRQRATPAL
jgi:hypothetical protein